ncbi:MAG TPA: hypothetical protein PK625_03055 [Spirochaetales bacterium]|nr:hypothetical protein [Spirochaetales bacterium]MBP7263265.1 hypothetical protein [Spirochaetia bacterium]HPE36100.1 hypothetical protein [Spirochaetales bacterium]
MNGLKTIRLAAVLALGLAAAHADERDALDAFKYDPAKMDVGTCYTYQLGNQAGTKTMQIYVYVKSEDTLLVYKDYSTIAPMVFDVEVRFDWSRMMFGEEYGLNPFWEFRMPNTNHESIGVWNWDKKRLPITMTTFDSKGREKSRAMVIEANLFPTFDFSLYHVDLQFALRHFVGDAGPWTIGGFYAGYYIESELKRVRQEMKDGHLCEVYELRGLGFLGWVMNIKQRIWVDKNDPYRRVIRYENDMKISPFDSVLLTLKEYKHMSLDEWHKMVEAFNKDAAGRLGLE